MKIEILEKDLESGYVLFEMIHDETRYQGSVEVIEREPEHDSYQVSLVIDIPKRADYIESMLANKITLKLREDYGLPSAPPKPKTQDKKTDDKKDKKKSDPKKEVKSHLQR